MNAKTEAIQADTKSIRAEMKAMQDKRMEANMNDDQKESTACQDAMEANPEKTVPHPEMMQSEEEHQEIPTEDAAVMLVGEPRKRCRVRYLAAESCRKRKSRNRGNHGSRRKSAATCRKASHRAAMARRKRNTFRKIRTEENCGQRKELTVTGMRTTRRARVAWHRENFVRKDWTRNQAGQGTPKPRKDGKRLWKGQEFNDGLREGLRYQPCSEIGIKDPDTRRQLHLRIKRTSDRIGGKTFRLEMVNEQTRCPSGYRE
jgi:hypothetical protein